MAKIKSLYLCLIIHANQKHIIMAIAHYNHAAPTDAEASTSEYYLDLVKRTAPNAQKALKKFKWTDAQRDVLSTLADGQPVVKTISEMEAIFPTSIKASNGSKLARWTCLFATARQPKQYATPSPWSFE